MCSMYIYALKHTATPNLHDTGLSDTNLAKLKYLQYLLLSVAKDQPFELLLESLSLEKYLSIVMKDYKMALIL